MTSGSPPPGRQSGITYLAVLFFVAVSSAMLAAVGTIWSHERQRQKEEELIWIGNQFRQAIALYYHRSPGTVKRYPAKLEDLLEDHRHLNVARYLRRIYRDPLTGKTKWGVVPSPQGGIMGVYSLSSLDTIKREATSPPSNVPVLEGERLSFRRFVYTPCSNGDTSACASLTLRCRYFSWHSTLN